MKYVINQIEGPNGSLDDLECRFEATVECFSKTNCSNPILVPMEEYEDNWNCGYHRPCKYKDC